MKISFDFDNTLDKKFVRQLCRYLISKHHDIYIVTTRRYNTLEGQDPDTYNKDLFESVAKLGIKRDNIIFTEYEWKYQILDKMNIDVHYDDNESEYKFAKENNAKVKIIIV